MTAIATALGTGKAVANEATAQLGSLGAAGNDMPRADVEGVTPPPFDRVQKATGNLNNIYRDRVWDYMYEKERLIRQRNIDTTRYEHMKSWSASFKASVCLEDTRRTKEENRMVNRILDNNTPIMEKVLALAKMGIRIPPPSGEDLPSNNLSRVDTGW